MYLTEQVGTSFTVALRRAHIDQRTDLHILRFPQVSNLSWPEIAAKAGTMCTSVGTKLLVTDTIGQFARFREDQENASGPWIEAIAPLQAIVEDGPCVFYSCHSRKSGGDVGDSARGSSQGGGMADILLSLRRAEGNHGANLRKIESLSRFDETPSELIIELGPDGYVARGSSDSVALDETRAKLHGVLPPNEGAAMTAKELAKEIGTPETTLRRVLKPGVLSENWTIQVIGTGKRGDPHKYYKLMTGET